MKLKAICLAAFFMCLLPFGFPESEPSEPSGTPLPAQSSEFDPVLVARLENMLEHNRVYGDAFSDVTGVVDRSMPALMDRAEDGFIKAEIVNGFVYHMYGLSTDGYQPDERLAQREGYYAVLPRGYAQIDHTITDITEQDGRLFVRSEVTVQTHDSQTISVGCETVFAVCSSSAFGYHILSSVMDDQAAETLF